MMLKRAILSCQQGKSFFNINSTENPVNVNEPIMRFFSNDADNKYFNSVMSIVISPIAAAFISFNLTTILTSIATSLIGELWTRSPEHEPEKLSKEELENLENDTSLKKAQISGEDLAHICAKFKTNKYVSEIHSVNDLNKKEFYNDTLPEIFKHPLKKEAFIQEYRKLIKNDHWLYSRQSDQETDIQKLIKELQKSIETG